MATKRVIPDLSNATPEFLLGEIRKYRDMQADGKFYEGIYKERLKTFDEYSADVKVMSRRVGDLQVDVSTSTVERIDVEKVKEAFTREELIEKGFLVAADVTQMRITKVTKE